jgi:uncharacterized transporter YbjL
MIPLITVILTFIDLVYLQSAGAYSGCVTSTCKLNAYGSDDSYEPTTTASPGPKTKSTTQGNP